MLFRSIGTKVAPDDIRSVGAETIAKLITAYQLIISNLLQNTDKRISKKKTVPKNYQGPYFECKICTGKKFISEKYLHAHYSRRHPDYKENESVMESRNDLCSQRIDPTICSQSIDESLNFQDSFELKKLNMFQNNLRDSIYSKKGEAKVQEMKDLLSNITTNIIGKTGTIQGEVFQIGRAHV